jgi:hypothetical protein
MALLPVLRQNDKTTRRFHHGGTILNNQRPHYQRLLATFALDLLADLLTKTAPPPQETEDERIDRIARELLADVEISFA